MRPPAPAPRRAALVLGCLVAAALASACKGRRSHRDPGPGSASGAAASRPAVPDRIEGTLTLDGEPLEIVGCRPGHEESVYVDLVTAVGALRFVGGEVARMFWNPRPDANGRGRPIPCSIPHRSWGGGTRADGGAYFRGELAFSCEGPPALAGKVTLDCGGISPDERASLDEQRRQKREELRRAGSAAPPAQGSAGSP